MQIRGWTVASATWNGRNLKITAPPPADLANKILLVLVGLSVLTGSWLALQPVNGAHRNAVSNTILIVAVLAVLLLTLWPWIEQAFGSQEVTVKEGILVWTRRTLLWTRTKEFRATQITQVVARTPKFLKQGVEIKYGGRKRRILNNLTSANAEEVARQLQRALRIRR